MNRNSSFLQVSTQPNGANTWTGIHLRGTIILTYVFVPYRFKRFKELSEPDKKREEEVTDVSERYPIPPECVWNVPEFHLAPVSTSKTNGTCTTLSSLYPTHEGSSFKTSHHHYYCYCSGDVNVYSWGLCRLVTVEHYHIPISKTWLGANSVAHTLAHTLKNAKILVYCAI